MTDADDEKKAALLAKAEELEKKIDAVVAKLGTSNPTEVKSLEYLKKELQTISADLKKPHLIIITSIIESRLSHLEELVAARLAKDEGQTVAPSTGKPTVAPTAPTTGAPTKAPTAAPTGAPTTNKAL